MRGPAWILFLVLFPAVAGAQAPAPQAIPPPDGIARSIRQIEQAIETNNPRAFSAMLAPAAARAESTTTFISDWIVPGVTRVVAHESLRVPIKDVPDGLGFDVFVDSLEEFGKSGRVGTWLVEFRRDTAADNWRIQSFTVLTTVAGIEHLELDPNKEFTVTNLTVSAEDFQIRLPQGVAFIADAQLGPTAIVLIGRGEFTFSPAPKSEKGQVKIFGGAETLQNRFEWAYLRINPKDFQDAVSFSTLSARSPDRRDFRRANQVFQDNVMLSFGLDLSDLSRDKWSVAPNAGDLVAELQTDKGHLAYSRSTTEPEDIRFFDRTNQRTISVYASKDKLASHGPFFDEDDRVPYDILDYQLDASFDPQRDWIDGTVRMYLVAKKTPISTLTLNLAESLVIRSVVSNALGYLMPLRVTGQNDVILNLPEPLQPNTAADITFVYGGRLPAVAPEREAIGLQADEHDREMFTFPSEASYVYTGRSFWYPEGQVTDYSTATMTLRVPEPYASVASGSLDDGYPKTVVLKGRNWKEYRFEATQPVRYLAWAISRFSHVDSAAVKVPPPPESADRPLGVSYSQVDLSVESTGMLKRRAQELSEVSKDVMKFYGTLLQDVPYQTFSLAVVERSTPGGHSPAYFAALSQPPPTTPIAWRADPAYFNEFPEFFAAHEAAHQWWGQAVGWENYHEQWLSEGFAQYFAALYAEKLNRGEGFDKVIAQMTRWAIERSDQGPVYLGYRVGHLKNDSRSFRAVVYNKGAIVLHMLRRLVGDEVFFRSLRRFYTTWRFRKASTEDLKHVFEDESHRSLDRFFDRWIYDEELPHLRFSYKTDGDAVVVRFEQVGEVFDVPVTVTLDYAGSLPPVNVVVPVVDQVTEKRIPLVGMLKDVDANHDNAAPVIFVK